MKTLSIKAILVLALLPVISHCCMIYGAAPQDTLDVPDSLVAKWKNIILNNLAASYFYDSVHEIKTVSAAELQELANKYLHPEKFYELVVY